MKNKERERGTLNYAQLTWSGAAFPGNISLLSHVFLLTAFCFNAEGIFALGLVIVVYWLVPFVNFLRVLWSCVSDRYRWEQKDKSITEQIHSQPALEQFNSAFYSETNPLNFVDWILQVIFFQAWSSL